MVIKVIKWIKAHAVVAICLLAYIAIQISVISWGIPSVDRLFLYHMDEWHQLMSVRAVRDHLTTIVPGAANGSMFHSRNGLHRALI